MPTTKTKSKTRKGAGRPSKLTKTLQSKICAAIRESNFFQTACWSVGITPKTGYNWLERGEKEKSGIYHDFYMAVMQADAQAEMDDINYIRNTTSKDDVWQSKAWIRERRSRERWGKPQLEVTGKDGGPIELDAKDKLLSLLGGIASREGTKETDTEAQPEGS